MMRHVSLVCALFVFALTTQFVTGDDAITKAKCPVSGKAASKDPRRRLQGWQGVPVLRRLPGRVRKGHRQVRLEGQSPARPHRPSQAARLPADRRQAEPRHENRNRQRGRLLLLRQLQGKAEKAKGDEQVDLVFGDKSFEKGFKVGEKK